MYIWMHDEDENGDGEEGREWRLTVLLYADDLVLCGELEEDLRARVGLIVVSRKRGLQVNVCQTKVMVLGGEEG